MRQIFRPHWPKLQLFFIETKRKSILQTSVIFPVLLIGLVLAVSVLMLLNPSLIQAVSPVALDSFDTEQTMLSQKVGVDVIPGVISSTVTSEEILGGERDLKVDINKGKTPGNRLSAGVSAGVVSISYGSSIAGSVQITWDGPDGDGATLDPIGLGGLDLTGGGTQDAFVLTVDLDDLPASLEIQVFSDGENSSLYPLSLPGAIYSSTQYVIPFSAFTTASGEGAVFSNVGAITLVVSADKPLDMMLSSFETYSTLTTTKTDALLVDNDENGQVNPGDTLQYTVTIANPTDSFGIEATDVMFTDTPDENTSLVAGSVTATQGTITSGNNESDTEVAVEVGLLADGDSVTIVFEVLVNDPLPEEVTEVANQGLVSSDTVASLPTDDPETDVVDDATITPVFPVAPAPPAPVVTASKADVLPDGSSEGQVASGDVLTYTVIIASRDAAATDVVFIDTPDQNTSLITGSVTTSQGTVTSGNDEEDTEVTVEVGSIADGDSVTIVFEVVVNATLEEELTELANQGIVSGSNFAETVTDDPDTDATDDPTVTQLVSP